MEEKLGLAIAEQRSLWPLKKPGDKDNRTHLIECRLPWEERGYIFSPLSPPFLPFPLKAEWTQEVRGPGSTCPGAKSQVERGGRSGEVHRVYLAQISLTFLIKKKKIVPFRGDFLNDFIFFNWS